jgi:ABC-2 type transport system ATP-binding protein
MSESPALQGIGISKRYGDHDALCDVTLTAAPGQLHGLLGPNGAGKTTLLRVLLGLIRRDAGSVRLLGTSLDSLGAPLPDGVAGFVETPGFYPYLSARRNLALLARLDDSTPDRTTSIAAVLEQSGLSAHADTLVSAHSTGMRQRLGIAAALLRKPRLLFVDEPTSSLDPAAARDVRALTRRLADSGVTVVFSSHDMSEVEALCSMLTVINRGRVIFSGTVGELRRLSPPPLHHLHTSDDAAARELARHHRAIRVASAAGTDAGLDVSADTESLDAYVIALGRAGLAVRALERRTRTLESLFRELTGHGDVIDESAGTAPDHGRATTVMS